MLNWVLNHRFETWAIVVAGLILLTCTLVFLPRRPWRWRWSAVLFSATATGALLFAGLEYKFKWIVPDAVQETRVSDPGAIARESPLELGPEDWGWWRGPGGTNVGAAGPAPLHWSAEENVVWKVAVPGRGHSSPVVHDSRIFLTTADDQPPAQSILAYDRSDGSLLWQKDFPVEGFDPAHANNSYASSTPACDGQRLFVVFPRPGALSVTAVSLTGEVEWEHRIDGYQAVHGYGASPVLFKSLLIVPAEGETSRVFTALDRRSGEVRWRVHFREFRMNYASPIVASLEGSEQLIIPGSFMVDSLDPTTGRQRWSTGWQVETASSTAVADGRHVYATGAAPDPTVLCLDRNGRIVWRQKSGAADVPSPLVVDGRVFLVNDRGIATCLDAATGEEMWRERLGGRFFSSPMSAAGRVYAANLAGMTYVFRAGPEFELLASNDVGEPIFASPVPSAGQLFLRTTQTLFCIGED